MTHHDLLDDNSLFKKYTYASLGQRFAASTIDLFFLGILSFVFNSLSPLIGNPEQYVLFLWFVFFPVYKLVSDATNGYTLGKWILKIKLVQDKDDFPPVGWLRAWKRVLIFSPLIFYFGIDVLFDSYVEERLSRATSLRTLSETSILINNLHRFNSHFEWPWLSLYGASTLAIIFTKPPKTLYDMFSETICIKQSN